ncbi:MAG TPA: HlyD family efflux transporter periplasmic adaptor subunit, partial [Tepidisphaeraceae bacterium]|nr:HlyD family efflux transporter periplasmic adaptor subunit [Tepidisphaeraceae bacterium]
MPDPIPTPLSLKLNRLKLQLGPALVFVLALGGAAWLWSRQSLGGTVAGEVSSVTLHVTAPRDGRLVETGSYPKLFDPVAPGQVLAVLTPDARNSAEQPINLVAPAGGSVTAIRRRPGEFVKQGQELFTVTRADSPHIISYVRSGSAIVPKKDGKVLVRSKRKTATATVQQVG